MRNPSATALLLSVAFPALLLTSCSTQSSDKSAVTDYPLVDFGVSAEEAEKRLSKLPKFLTAGPLFSTEVLEPTMLFDNVGYVGYVGVGAFVIHTSDGLILIDAMWTPNDAQDVILPGINKLGFDPSQIKYVVVTHGHADHYGAAQYLEERYGATVVMSQRDWDDIHSPDAQVLTDPFGNYSSEIPLPKKFLAVDDGDELTLGDTTLTILSTPGHTPGGISIIFPVTDNGEPHTAAIWGGTGLPQTLQGNQDYLSSLNYFDSTVQTVEADVSLSTHPFANGLIEQMNILQTRKAGEPNPIIIGTKAHREYIDSTLRKNVLEKISTF